MIMICSDCSTTNPSEFHELMQKVDKYLNDIAAFPDKTEYFLSRSGSLIEHDVYEAMKVCAIGTPFENSITLVSGYKFPDIVAKDCFGVEVKSTQQNHWTSTGSSILETTRVPDVGKIYLTFAKLAKPIQFLSKPYEECLSDIAVTHYPRYRINMCLKDGETIFEKIGIPYEELCKMANPVVPVSKYYRNQLKDGEYLWWLGDGDEIDSPPRIKAWNALSDTERIEFTVQGFVQFPEVFASKYNNFAFWLILNYSILTYNTRDIFSASGQEFIEIPNKGSVKMPAVFNRVQNLSRHIKKAIQETDKDILYNRWGQDIQEDRVKQWCHIAADYTMSKKHHENSLAILLAILNNTQ